MKMRSFIFYVVGLLGGVVIAPTVCPAEDSDRFSFPLPLSLEVGDHWTYSIVTIRWKNEDRTLDTLSTETLTIRVVERLQIEDQIYFALSDGGIYRVDEASRTWQYDTEAKSEKIVWDIWGPLKEDFHGVSGLPYSVIEKPVIDGYAGGVYLSRYGPFVRRPHPEFEEVDVWIATIDADTVGADTIRYDWDIGHFLYFPYVWTYNDVIKFPDWGITELYLFEKDRYMSERSGIMNFVVAPNVGVVYYAFARYHYADLTLIEKIEKTVWILQGVQKGDPESTVVEDISFGQLKQRMTHPAPNAP